MGEAASGGAGAAVWGDRRIRSGSVGALGSWWAGLVFISTFEKQLDGKRRIVAPQEFRATVAPFDGLYCFPSIEADCIEGGGKALFDSYRAVIAEYPFGDPTRTALETSIMGGMCQLSFDTAGRITLPDSFCGMFGLTDWVTLVGLGDRFQIWPRDAFRERIAQQREAARQGLIDRARRAASPIAANE